MLAICQPFLADPLALQGRLCRRIERHIKELFVFVAEPDVPSDNNPAERSLRHLVISRKVSGGTRSERGTESKMTLASIFGTLARTRPEPPRRLPPTAHFPSNLNCYRDDWLSHSAPRGAMIEHGVEYHQQFAHGRDQRHLFRLTSRQ